MLWLFLIALAAAAICLAHARDDVPALADEKWILVELHRKRLTLYQGKTALSVYPIASGAADTPSPIGIFRITHRFTTELSGFGTRYLGLNVPWGQYGIHGTNAPSSIGSNASHGCIRMRVRDAEALYRAVPNGTVVVIEGGAYGALDGSLRTLRPGDRSARVREAQKRLRLHGYMTATADGVYGAQTSRAVLAARKALGLPAVDRIDAALYRALGIVLFE